MNGRANLRKCELSMLQLSSVLAEAGNPLAYIEPTIEGNFVFVPEVAMTSQRIHCSIQA